MNKDYIYFDNNATTKVDPQVVEVMLPFFLENYGNAASLHQYGSFANNAVKNARGQISSFIGCEPNEIIFTSGATESINLSLKGFALANRNKGNHIIILKTEHSAVLDTCKYLETVGFEVSYLSVKKDGLIDLNLLKEEIKENTILISVMLVNNEIGVIQPVKEIAEITHNSGLVLFCDATQAVGKIETKVDELDVDIMAFSGHKFYGPKGIGVLYIRSFNKNNLKIEAILHGGGHENGLRSGTLNVPAIVGLGKACEIAREEMQNDLKRIITLRNKLETELLKIPNSFVNGSIKSRMYNLSNICFPGINANVIMGRMKNIAVSNGSACSSAIIKPSHVLKAIGLSDESSFASIRFSLGKFNNESEVNKVCNVFKEQLQFSSSDF